VAHDFVRRESDQRKDGLRRAAFHPDKSNRLKDSLGRLVDPHHFMFTACAEWSLGAAWLCRET
ncbi:MAG: hypothetical protein ACQESR_09685, partial [Planctomycetota bacterium]